jgi:hypothetical protein
MLFICMLRRRKFFPETGGRLVGSLPVLTRLRFKGLNSRSFEFSLRRSICSLNSISCCSESSLATSDLFLLCFEELVPCKTFLGSQTLLWPLADPPGLLSLTAPKKLGLLILLTSLDIIMSLAACIMAYLDAPLDICFLSFSEFLS